MNGNTLGRCWLQPVLFAIALLITSANCTSALTRQEPEARTGDAQTEATPQLPSAEDPFGVRADPRYREPQDLNGYFPFQVPENLEQWEARREVLKRRMTFALGLDPAPEVRFQNPVIHSTRAYDGYRISRVFFESLPGFYVTGSLYRPLEDDDESDLRPGILCPHGHWENGRFLFASDDEVNEGLKFGAETLECAARSPLQARCVHLARMGCVVFHYDMIGYADSRQIPAQVAHQFQNQRLKLSAPGHSGLFSPQAELHNLSVMTLQTVNSIASLDFLTSLPGVDPDRLAITGASGGGTQSFILAALDPRLDLSFPAVMVGTAMQGGCTCENCSNLRTWQGNVDFAALFAPKPQGMTAADDWTVELESKGFPELQQLYQLYGKPDQVHLTSRTEFKHNYNQVGREAMYQWVARYFDLSAMAEREFPLLRSYQLSVWSAEDESPREGVEYQNEWNGQSGAFPDRDSGPEFEQRLVAWWLEHRGLKEIDYQAACSTWQDVYFPNEQFGSNPAYQWRPVEDADQQPANLSSWALVDSAAQSVIPIRIFGLDDETGPESTDRSTGVGPDLSGRSVTLYLGHGVNDLLDADGAPSPWLIEQLSEDSVVIQVDLWGQGAHRQFGGYDPLDIWQKTRREFAGYVYGYNLPPAIHRAHDFVRALRAISVMPEAPDQLTVVAAGPGAVAATLAAPVLNRYLASGQTPLTMIIQLDGFRFGQIQSLLDPAFVPGAMNWGDVTFYWNALLQQQAVDLTIRDRDLSDWKAVARQPRKGTLRIQSVLGGEPTRLPSP